MLDTPDGQLMTLFRSSPLPPKDRIPDYAPRLHRVDGGSQDLLPRDPPGRDAEICGPPRKWR